MDLKEWTNKVNNMFIEKYELGVYDLLGDFPSWDMHDSGMTPQEAFDELAIDVEDQIELAEQFFK
jgi:hypothetical protein